MKVVILAGGFGTRLSEYTKVLPKPMVTISTAHTYRLFKSVQRSVEVLKAIKISNPPIVGVPFFVKGWLSGPSALIGWPSPWSFFN